MWCCSHHKKREFKKNRLTASQESVKTKPICAKQRTGTDCFCSLLRRPGALWRKIYLPSANPAPRTCEYFVSLFCSKSRLSSWRPGNLTPDCKIGVETERESASRLVASELSLCMNKDPGRDVVIFTEALRFPQEDRAVFFGSRLRSR
jgi:hypothetical protein